MVTFGVDVSHHQDVVDFAALRQGGIEFAFIKSTEGGSFVDDRFARNLAAARTAGLVVAAYHYVRSDASAAAQVANVRRVVPPDVPIIPDVEANSGALPLTTDVVARLRAAGYSVPLLYIPRWYWQQLGSPSMFGFGLPYLWSSRYPDTRIGDLVDEYAQVPHAYWNGYGGLDVAVLQFTSSARIAGRAPLDANAYRGTIEQLATLLGYTQHEREDNPMRNLRLARATDGVAVWVGDGLSRRWVQDETELSGLQYWIGQAGGDPTVVENWEDLRVLGWPIAQDVTDLKARPIADVDEAALATELQARGITGITPQQVKEVVQAVFRDAATDDDDASEVAG